MRGTHTLLYSVRKREFNDQIKSSLLSAARYVIQGSKETISRLFICNRDEEKTKNKKQSKTRMHIFEAFFIVSVRML